MDYGQITDLDEFRFQGTALYFIKDANNIGHGAKYDSSIKTGPYV